MGLLSGTEQQGLTARNEGFLRKNLKGGKVAAMGKSGDKNPTRNDLQMQRPCHIRNQSCWREKGSFAILPCSGLKTRPCYRDCLGYSCTEPLDRGEIEASDLPALSLLFPPLHPLKMLCQYISEGLHMPKPSALGKTEFVHLEKNRNYGMSCRKCVLII